MIARNIIIYSELEKILSAFSASDIKTIVLAGAALGKTVYPSIAERPMGDIDLLIKPSDKKRIGESLENLGYVLDTERSDEAHYSKTLGDFTLHIDCHTDLRHYLDDRALAAVWNRVRPVRSNLYALSSMLILSPEDAFIYTCVDAAIYHGRITANTINDLRHIISYYSEPSPLVGEGRVRGMGGLEWDMIIKRIKSYRLETPLYILFDLCRKQGIPIPDEVMDSLILRKRSLEYRLYKAILNSASCILYPSSHEDASRVLLFLFRPVARWELFMNSFFPSLRFIKQQYAENLYSVSCILYPLRLCTLIWRMNKAMCQVALKML